MTKVIKKGIRKAIIIYEDPDLKEGRGIIFGELSLLMEFMMEQLPLIWERLQEMSGKKFSNPFEMFAHYKKTKKDYIKTHGVKAAEDMEMSLTYEVKEVK